MTGREQWRDQLAEALDNVDLTGPHPHVTRREVDALLPVVAGIVADELRAAADEVDTWSRPYVGTPAYVLRTRADRYDPP